MATKGWTVPTWPKAYGGAGLDPAQYLILLEELRRINARSPLVGRGVNTLVRPFWNLAQMSKKNAGYRGWRAAMAVGVWVIPSREQVLVSQSWH